MLEEVRYQEPSETSLSAQADPEVMAILEEFSSEHVSLEDHEGVERVMVAINDRLRMTESISAILHVMQASQTRCRPPRDIAVPPAPPPTSDPPRPTLTMDDARRMLDSQFASRRRLLEAQRQRSLLEVGTRPPSVAVRPLFVPSLQGDFLPLAGLEEVVGLLLPSPGPSLPLEEEAAPSCGQCGSGMAPLWRLQGPAEVLCEGCEGGRRLREARLDYEWRLAAAGQAWEAGERALARDYEEMRACPAKMALFRAEQQRRLLLQAAPPPEPPADPGPPPPALDEDTLRRARQLLALLQASPQLAANDTAVLELLAGVCGLQGVPAGPQTGPQLLARILASQPGSQAGPSPP